ncbi:peptidylprolyl isomerase [Psychrosphaera sp. 1_MG-2023]|nr:MULTISPECIES: peptidylprolyl isomerase [unclassified Psychrosphaera]MDO6718256.1 peptidylprolyl isomerase [Psychrosphaera sp. 1_MG-2023]
MASIANVAAAPRGEYIQPDNLYPKVKFITNMGELIVELDRAKAPITVNNFLSYVVAERYNNTQFHRLEPQFVLQGGGYTTEMESVTEYPPIVNESGNGLKNEQYTISMARQYAPHSGTSQFFFNLGDNKSLDPGRNWGYAVFGSVTLGEDIFEKIEAITTGTSPELGWPSFPDKPIIIHKIEVLAE